MSLMTGCHHASVRSWRPGTSYQKTVQMEKVTITVIIFETNSDLCHLIYSKGPLIYVMTQNHIWGNYKFQWSMRPSFEKRIKENEK